MKRKIAALLMGTTLSVAVCGYSVQAMTYGYDMGGKVVILSLIHISLSFK